MSPAQRRVFDAVDGFIRKHGFSPSVREIADAIGIGCPTVYFHLNALQRAGYLKSQRGNPRTLRVVREPEDKAS